MRTLSGPGKKKTSSHHRQSLPKKFTDLQSTDSPIMVWCTSAPLLWLCQLLQGLVTVPFWVYWTSPEKVAMALTIYLPYIGWCDPWGHQSWPMSFIVVSSIVVATILLPVSIGNILQGSIPVIPGEGRRSSCIRGRLKVAISSIHWQ